MMRRTLTAEVECRAIPWSVVVTMVTLLHLLLMLLCFLPPTSAQIFATKNLASSKGSSPGLESSKSCRTLDGGLGECKELFSCRPVVENFRRIHPVPCGFHGVMPLVCCPRTEHESRGVRPSPPPSVLATPSPTTSIPAPSSIDFDCGLRNGNAHPLFGEVVGGKEAQPNTWPWMAIIGSLGYRGRITWFCGGVLITPTTVITASHCTLNSHVDVVRVGEHDFLSLSGKVDTLKDHTVIGITIHPGYRPGRNLHDLALLLLSEPVVLSLHVVPVCLPWAEDAVNVTGRQLSVTGWGATKYNGAMSPRLREAVVTVFRTGRCHEAYNSLPDYEAKFGDGIGEDFLCAGDPKGGKDACRGDSGGPLVYNSFGRYVLAGIVTAGLGCGHVHYPGIYTNILTHLQWIRDTAF